MTSVGGHSALRGTVCTWAECPGGHCALGQDVWGDVLHGERPALRYCAYNLYPQKLFTEMSDMYVNTYLKQLKLFSLSLQACNDFGNNGTCVTQCPPARIYDPNLFRVVPNPDFRLAAGDLCVLQCPGEQCDWSVTVWSVCTLVCRDCSPAVVGYGLFILFNTIP